MKKNNSIEYNDQLKSGGSPNISEVLESKERISQG